MASSPLPCPLTHRLTNGRREGERPRAGHKDKGHVGRGARKTGDAEAQGRGAHREGLAGKGLGFTKRRTE